MLTEELVQGARQYLMNTYTRYPVGISRGHGTRVYDMEGREYLDFLAGIAVNALGHCHPKVTLAIQKQAQSLLHASNLFYTEPQISLARVLVDHSFADKVFFCNSGAEANEAAIKLARRWAHERDGAGRFEIVSMVNSFHGRTLATLTATGQDKVQKGYEPLPEGFRYVPFNDVEALSQAVTTKTAAVLLEPVQGEGGVWVATQGYLKACRDICSERGALLMFDEVQTGIGRTGRLFAYDSDAERLDRLLEVILEDQDTLGHCARMGEHFRKSLEDLQGGCPTIKEIRGMGLLIGIEVSCDARELVEGLRKRGVLANATSDRVLRFVPPLIVSQSEIDRVVATLGDVIQASR